MSNIALEGLVFLLTIGSLIVIVPLFDFVFRVVKKAEHKRKMKKGK